MQLQKCKTRDCVLQGGFHAPVLFIAEGWYNGTLPLFQRHPVSITIHALVQTLHRCITDRLKPHSQCEIVLSERVISNNVKKCVHAV